MAHAMVPLEHAFEQRSSQVLRGLDARILSEAQRCASVFAAELRDIPQRADSIQRELNRSVWNGNVRLAMQAGKEGAFSRSLLREISTTGLRTQEVFEQSISDLHETVLAAMLHDSRFRASLAGEIMDRNLYERANDCRWWALNGTLRDCLAGTCDAAAATEVLERINGLYTVYDNIVLFDRDCRVVAVSNPKQRTSCGQALTQQWARETLALRDTQSFVVSRFEPLASYGGNHTYVFTAAIQGADGILGGIAIVFDSTPQFAAMLHDVVPLDKEGKVASECCAVLADADGKVIAATSRYRPGERIEFAGTLLRPPADGAVEIVALDGMYYAVGARCCAGYREFAGVGATAIVMMALGAVQAEQRQAAAGALQFTRRSLGDRDLFDVAVVSCGGHWLAIPKQYVVEAVEAGALTCMPGRAAWLSGVTRYSDVILPVVDLGHLLHSDARVQAVVVLRDGQQLVGLAVDQLGEVLQISPGEISALDALRTDEGTPLISRVVRPREPGDHALM